MAKGSVVDEAAVQRLRQEIARDRLRLAQAMALAPDLPESAGTGGELPRVGRLYRVFALMGEC